MPKVIAARPAQIVTQTEAEYEGRIILIITAGAVHSWITYFVTKVAFLEVGPWNKDGHEDKPLSPHPGDDL